ncbi:putative quinol monooxygenase [Chitinophaga sp.]|uniref:putative quinol monooxygenase n=1 Tax=Chitinophaga sp. TaxID=1869181 RepID=UPI002F92CCBB
MNHKPVSVFARWQVKEGQLETVLALLTVAAEKSRQEPGNLFYKLHQSITDPHTLVLFEGYADEPAANAHRESAHFQEIVVGKIVPLLAGREVIVTTGILDNQG